MKATLLKTPPFPPSESRLVRSLFVSPVLLLGLVTLLAPAVPGAAKGRRSKMSSESSQSGHLCRLRTKHLWPALALLSLSLGACEVEDLSKQINSASRLKVLAILINEHKQNHGEISAVTIKSIAEKESFQADLWGHEMAVLVRDESFLIIYPGRDGKFDVDDIARYFNQDPVNVTGMYDHDLVVENRHLLTIVGKEVPAKFPKRPLIPGKLP